MIFLDFSETNSQITDEIVNVPDSNPVGLVHSLLYNKAGKLVVISTAAGGGGTVLTDVTDYVIGGIYSDGLLPSSISPDVAYSTISIVNATYHNTVLYVSYYPITDLFSAAAINDNIGDGFNSPAGATKYYANEVVKTMFWTVGASDVDLDLPAAANIPGGELVIIRVDSGAGIGSIVPDGSETINGEASVNMPAQYNKLHIKSDGTNWVVIDHDLFWNSDWLDYSGANALLDLTEDITHSLNKSLAELDISAYYAATATPAESGIFNLTAGNNAIAGGATDRYGVGLSGVDVDSIRLQTGLSGIIYLTVSGNLAAWTAGYIKLVVKINIL